MVKAAVTQKGFALSYASEKLKEDKEVVKAAVMQNGMALQRFGQSEGGSGGVSGGRDANGEALYFASGELRENPKVVKAAVMQNGMALQHA